MGVVNFWWNSELYEGLLMYNYANLPIVLSGYFTGLFESILKFYRT